jgi:hypothetical protein
VTSVTSAQSGILVLCNQSIDCNLSGIGALSAVGIRPPIMNLYLQFLLFTFAGWVTVIVHFATDWHTGPDAVCRHCAFGVCLWSPRASTAERFEARSSNASTVVASAERTDARGRNSDACGPGRARHGSCCTGSALATGRTPFNGDVLAGRVFRQRVLRNGSSSGARSRTFTRRLQARGTRSRDGCVG